MSEVLSIELPIPLSNYANLIKSKKYPYYEVVKHIIRELEAHYKNAGKEVSEVIYTINPRVLQEEVEKKVKSEKLTTLNVCRIILALLHGSRLRPKEDFYITTSSHGRKNYHIRVNTQTLTALMKFI